ncbi:hypothetical protein KU616_23895, partial [Salmonella enterica subsp. enterica serovar Mbandaka]|nr:hypothetical protein [Salmonella enterica subsp. enterica serovar Mbandaka]
IAENLVSNRIPVLISNHDTALTREWYQLAKLHVVKVRRSISSQRFGGVFTQASKISRQN